MASIEKKKKPEEPLSPAPAAAQPAAPQAPNTQEKITFNPDKSVNYGIGDKSYNLTPGEYKNFVGGGVGATMTPNVQALQQDIQDAALRKQIYDQLTRNAKIEKFKNEIIGQELARSSPPIDAQGTDLPQVNDLILAESSKVETSAKDKIAAARAQNGEIGAFGKEGALDVAVQESVLYGSRTTANIYDNLRATITGGETADIKGARASFTQAGAAIESDINLVRQGLLSPSEAMRNFELAVQAQVRLENAAKKKGLNNLRYWVRDGKDLETDILINRQFLEKQRDQLLIAEQQAIVNAQQQRVAEAQRTFGQ